MWEGLSNPHTVCAVYMLEASAFNNIYWLDTTMRSASKCNALAHSHCCITRITATPATMMHILHIYYMRIRPQWVWISGLRLVAFAKFPQQHSRSGDRKGKAAERKVRPHLLFPRWEYTHISGNQKILCMMFEVLGPRSFQGYKSQFWRQILTFTSSTHDHRQWSKNFEYLTFISKNTWDERRQRGGGW